jgi:plasmid replication initiation protein
VKDLKTPKQVITTDNELIESSYRMTLNEKRLLMLGLAKVNPQVFPSKDEPIKFTVTAKEFEKAYSIANAYPELKEAAKNLRSRFVRLHDKTGMTEEINWIDSIRYYAKQGKVTVRLSWSIQVRLQGMLEQFTKIDLTKVSKLNSFYAIRLYELLKQFDSTGFRSISLKDFRFAMGIDDGVYSSTGELKRAVLKASLKELAAKSDLDISYVDVKDGRNIVGFKFYFRNKDQLPLF